jgi:hypothetical protein
MADGALVGVLLFISGLLLGGGSVWYITSQHNAEKAALYRAIGQMQNELAHYEAKVPEEEM